MNFSESSNQRQVYSVPSINVSGSEGLKQRKLTCRDDQYLGIRSRVEVRATLLVRARH